jgi:exopolysaccharide biosynthesis polyprenyl glycosylphosphotransferase
MSVLGLLGMPAIVLFAPLVWLGAALVWHGRYGQSTPDLVGHARGFLTVGVVAIALVAILVPLTPPTDHGRMVLALLAATVPLALGLRLSALVWHTLRAGRSETPALLVGAPARTAAFLAGGSSVRGFRGVGACTMDDDVTQLARQCGAKVVLLLDCDPHDTRLRQLSWNLRADGLRVVLPLPDTISASRLNIKSVSGSAVLEVAPPSADRRGRAFEWAERVGAALVLFLILPVLAVIAAAITFDSRGPVFFKQYRTGQNGTRFQIFKFRTMVPDAEERKAELLAGNQYSKGTLFKMKADPRVTRVGKVLRATSLDELPQIINIVRGEMSWIGPRPTSATVEAMRDDYRRRVLVKPGITGLWQVSGRSNLSFDEAVTLDLFYVENRSAALDASILARTVGAVVKREGAY